jgi:hypothetical protein
MASERRAVNSLPREVVHLPTPTQSFSELVTSNSRLRQTHENRVILNTIKTLFYVFGTTRLVAIVW